MSGDSAPSGPGQALTSTRVLDVPVGQDLSQAEVLKTWEQLRQELVRNAGEDPRDQGPLVAHGRGLSLVVETDQHLGGAHA